MPTYYFTGNVKEVSYAELLSSHISGVKFEIEKVLSRATTAENCMKLLHRATKLEIWLVPREYTISQEAATRTQNPCI